MKKLITYTASYYQKKISKVDLFKNWSSSLYLLFFFLVFKAEAQIPTITSFAPLTEQPGATVTITGTNFDPIPSNNIVTFGATIGIVTNASLTSLDVEVPIGATYNYIRVLNTISGLTAISTVPFMPIFSPSKSGISTYDLETRVDFASSSPTKMKISDLDGDGKADLIAINPNSNLVSVYRNTSSTGIINAGSFDAAINLTTGNAPYGVAVGDVDGDGKPDIVVPNENDTTISVYHNTSTSGTISFAARVNFATNSVRPVGVVIGDIDGDGKPDLAVTCILFSMNVFRNTSTVGVIDNTSFASAVSFGGGNASEHIAIGDIDGDGKPDLIKSNLNGGNVLVFRNTSTVGTITFDGGVGFATGLSPTTVEVGDLDGDGKLDLAVSVAGIHSVSVFHNTATSGIINASSFATKVDFTTGTSPRTVDIGDINGDGKPELVVSNNGSNSISIFRNNATSGTLDANSFLPKVDFTADGGVWGVAIGDLDGDEKPDIATGNYSTISVFRNSLVPSIDSFSPGSGCPNTTPIVIYGSDFTSTSAVSFGGTPASSYTVNSATQITAIPANGTSGVISVTTNLGTGNSSGIFYVNPFPYLGCEITNPNVLYDNGPFVSVLSGHPNTSPYSNVDSNTYHNIIGYNCNNATGSRLMDEFTNTESWSVDSIDVYVYQTGSDTFSTITGAYLAIWDADPSQGPANLEFGDFTTNRIISSDFTAAYRSFNLTTPLNNRPIMRVRVQVNALIPPGTHWVEYGVTGSLLNGPFSPPVTIVGQSTTGNGYRKSGSSYSTLYSGGYEQGIPFKVYGTNFRVTQTIPASLCVRDSITVDFFDPVVRNVGNSYVVELSDINGNFPGMLLTTVVVGPYQLRAAIPGITDFGFNYKARVIASDYADSSFAGEAFTITKPNVICPTNLDICINTAAFPLGGAMPLGGDFSGIGVDASDNFDPQIAGVGNHTITYLYTDIGGCYDTCMFQIRVHDLPVPIINSNGITAICNNNVVPLNTTVSYVNYLWSTSDNMPFILVNSIGTYTVQVTDEYGCIGTSLPFDIIAKPPLNPIISATGSINVCENDTVTLEVDMPNTRWASSVINFSSEYSNEGWSANQALGRPNLYPAHADDIRAWSPASEDDQREFIVLGYANPAPINFIDIYETYGVGSIDTVYVKNPNTGLFEIVYFADAITLPPFARILHVTFPLTAFPVSEIRIALNTAAVPSWNEIDAVGIGASAEAPYVSYVWSPNLENQPSLLVTHPNNSYFVTVTDIDGCTGISNTIQTTFLPIPMLTAQADTVCAGAIVDLTAKELAIGGTGGTWTDNASIIVPDPTQANSNGSPFTYTYSDGNCSNTTTLTYHFYPTLTPFVTNPFSTYCEGTHPILHASIGANGALQMDGVDDYVDISVNVNETEYTTEFWFKTLDANAGLYVVSDSDPLNQVSYDRALRLDGGNISAYVWSDETITTSGTNYADGNWHHVAHTIGASIGGQALYVDGEWKAGGTKAASDFNFENRILVGFSYNAGNPFLQGSIDELRVWNVARTASEISANYNKHISYSTPGLLAYYSMDDANNVLLTDSTVNNISGILNNGVSRIASSQIPFLNNISIPILWSPNNETTSNIIVASSGNYSFSITDTNGCIFTSPTYSITEKPKPNAAVTPVGPITICEGDSITLCSNVLNTPYLHALSAFSGASSNDIAQYEFSNFTPPALQVNNAYTGLDIVGSNSTYGLDYNPANGLTYFIADSNDNPGRHLYTVNVQTGEYAHIGKIVSTTNNQNVQDFTFDNNGVLYAVFQGGIINTIDYSSPSLTPSLFVLSPSNLPSNGGVGLTYDYDHHRLLYATGSYSPNIFSVDINTGQTNYLLTINENTAQAIEYIGNDIIVGSGTFGMNRIFWFDLNVGVTNTVLQPTGSYTDIKDLMFTGSPVQWYQEETPFGASACLHLSPSSNTFYSVVETNQLGCADTSNVVQVIVTPKPILTPQTISICADITSVNLAALEASIGFTGGTWVDNNADPIVDPTNVNPIGTPFTYIYTNGICTSSTTVTYIINPLPNPVIQHAGYLSFCLGENTVLSVEDTYASYLWHPNAEVDDNIQVASAGNYSVTVSDNFGCVGTSSPVSVVTFANPSVVGLLVDTICSQESIPLNINGVVGAIWEPSNSLNTNSGLAVIANPIETTTYTITSADGGNCSVTKTVHVNPSPLPIVKALGGTELCPGNSLTLLATGGNGIQFDGINDEVRIEGSPDFEYTKGTIEAWVRPSFDVMEPLGNPVLFNYSDNLNTRFSYHIANDLESLILTNGTNTVSWNFTFTSGNWIHIAFAESGGQTECFVDGVSLGVQPLGASLATGLQFHLGNANGLIPFEGAMDEIRVWNTARTASQILNNRFNPVSVESFGLVAYYPFDVECGIAAKDISLQHNDGYLINGVTWLTPSNSPFGNANIVDYLWTSGGGNLSFINASTSGVYFVQVTDANGCTGVSQNTNVTVQDNIAPLFGGVAFPAPAKALSQVAEASQFNVVYALDIPTNADWDLNTDINYAINNAPALAGIPFSRLAYMLELDTTYAWVSFDAFTTNLEEVGVPADYIAQQSVSNMNVFSNHPNVTTGLGISTGNIEFWSNCYDPLSGNINILSGNDALLDFNDAFDAGNEDCFGSMQIHNWGSGESILSYNSWSSGSGDIGIGNGTNNPDWTFESNVGNFTKRKLYVLVDAFGDGCPPNITVNANHGNCTYLGPIGIPIAIDNCGSPIISGPVPSGPYPVGNTIVTWTATDASNNSTTCTQIVNVKNPLQTDIIVAGNPIVNEIYVYSVPPNPTPIQTHAISVPGFTVLGINAITRNPITGEYFAVIQVSTNQQRRLIKVNIQNGIGTYIGNLGDRFASITFDDNGNLYGVTGENSPNPETLYQLNTSNASKTLLTLLGNGDGGEVIAFNSSDAQIYHWSGTTNMVFERIDPANAFAVTSIPISGDPTIQISGAVYAGGGIFYIGDNSNNLYLQDVSGFVYPAIGTLAQSARGFAIFSDIVIDNTSGSGITCANQPLTIDAGPGSDYLWSTNETTQTIQVNTTGSYTVEVTDANGCNDISLPIQITVNPIPVVTCVPSYTVSASANAFALQGGLPFGGTYSINGVEETTFDPGIQGIGNHSIIYSYADNNGCSATCTYTISVISAPTVICPADTAICINASLFVLNDAIPFGGTYNGVGVTANQFNAAIAGVGQHAITYNYTDPFGGNASCTYTITVNPLPIVFCPNYAAVCMQDAPFLLTGGSPAGGIYSGPGVSAGLFDPAQAGLGNHSILYTYTDGNGCYNACSFALQVLSANTGITNVTACDTFANLGVTYTTSGVYTRTFTNVNGCDSVNTLNLTIVNTNSGTSTQTACGSYTFLGQTYTSSGTYVFGPFVNAVDCDSTHILFLTIQNANTGNSSASACNSYTWTGTTYTTSGVYTKTFTGSLNCDSIHTLTLTIRNSSTSSSSSIACNSYIWTGTTYTTSGIYTKTFTNAANCDSLHTLNLTIHYANTGTSAETACDSLTWSSTTYTASGVYTKTFTNVNNCDSVHTKTIILNISNTGSSSANVCDSYTWTGTTYSNSGTYTKTFTNVNNCDSVHTLSLIIRYSNSGNSTATACASYEWAGTTYTASGNYSQTFTNVHNCDSVHTLMLTINYANAGISSATACDSLTWTGTTYTTSGIYTKTFTNVNTCDSVHSLTLTIHYSSSSATTQNGFGCYTWPINGVTYTTSGTYTETSLNNYGCTHTDSLQLTLIPEVQLTAKVILAGAYNSNTNLMSDSLRVKGLLPNKEPYSISPFNKPAIADTSGEMIGAGVLSVSGANAIVDWVFIELRDAINPSLIIATKRALVQRDGDVVSHLDGVSPVGFRNTLPGNYYVAIKHRNHLGSMSNAAINFPICSGNGIDFSMINPVYVNPFISNLPRKMVNGLYMLWPGDANANKNTKYNGAANDKDKVLEAVGTPNGITVGYRPEDINLDGNIRYNGLDHDRGVILLHVGVSTPNTILGQHTPN